MFVSFLDLGKQLFSSTIDELTTYTRRAQNHKRYRSKSKLNNYRYIDQYPNEKQIIQ